MITSFFKLILREIDQVLSTFLISDYTLIKVSIASINLTHIDINFSFLFFEYRKKNIWFNKIKKNYLLC